MCVCLVCSIFDNVIYINWCLGVWLRLGCCVSVVFWYVCVMVFNSCWKCGVF